jgi:hypothetical protein
MKISDKYYAKRPGMSPGTPTFPTVTVTLVDKQLCKAFGPADHNNVE